MDSDDIALLKNNIADIFQQAQLTTATHQKCLVSMKKLFSKSDPPTFWDAFRPYLRVILRSNYTTPNVYVERGVEFVASFCTSIEKVKSEDDDDEYVESPFVVKVFAYLTERQNDYDHVVRYRSVQLVGQMLSRMTTLSEGLCEDVQDAMLERSRDPRATIRLQTMKSMYLLQDPSNIDCPVIDEYKQRIADNNVKVRLVCVEKIAKREDVAPLILERTRDVNVRVRLAAYTRSTKIPMLFNIVEKQELVKNAFSDSSEHVKAYVAQTLLPAWLTYYDENYLEFLKKLRIDSDEKDLRETVTVAEYVLIALFSTKPREEIMNVLALNDKRLLRVEDLNYETVMYWRFLIEHLKRRDEHDDFVAEFVDFCDFVKSYYVPKKDVAFDGITYTEHQFVLNQLLKIAGGYDFGDQRCCQWYNSLLCSVVKECAFDTEVAMTLVRQLDVTLPSVSAKIQFVTELISEIMYCPQAEAVDVRDYNFEIAQLKVKLHCLRESLEQQIRERDFLRADSINSDIEVAEEQLRNARNSIAEEDNALPVRTTNVSIIRKYLDLIYALLYTPKLKCMNGMLRSLFDDVVKDLLLHENEVVQAKAMRNYALCCLIDKKMAEVGIHIFCKPIEEYNSGGVSLNTEILLTSMGAVVDMIILFGADLVANPKESADTSSESIGENVEAVFKGGTCLTSIVQAFVNLLNEDNAEIQERAGHGLCILILAGRVRSSSVLSRLIVKWCNPITGEESMRKLQQIIGLFLERLPHINDLAYELQEAIVPTVKIIVKAPRNSPLADVNVENVTKCLIELCRLSPEAEQLHFNLAVTLCQELHDRPQNKCNVTFSRMLLMLLVPKNKAMIEELVLRCDDIRNVATVKTVITNVIKFTAKLNAFDGSEREPPMTTTHSKSRAV